MLYISIIVLSIAIYAFVFALILSYKPSYEYSMYYKKKMTKYWAGNATMTIDTTKKMEFCYELNPVDLSTCTVEQANLQFIGKNTQTKENENKLQYIYGKDIKFYWQWKDDVNFDNLFINIKIKSSENFKVSHNGQQEKVFSPESNDFELIKVGLNYKKQNEIAITSSVEMQVVEIYFS